MKRYIILSLLLLSLIAQNFAQTRQAAPVYRGRLAAAPSCTQVGQYYIDSATGLPLYCTAVGSPGNWTPLAELAPKITTITDNYTATSDPNQVLLVNITSAKTATFPAIGSKPQIITVKRIDTSTATLTLVPSGANTIEGAASVTIATGGTGGTYVSNPATGIWRLLSTYIPATIHALCYPITAKAGDTATNPTTETIFATKCAFPANYLSVGQKIYVSGAGRYQITTGTVSPTAIARIKMNSVNVIQSPALSVGVGTGINYGFTFSGTIIVQSTGVTGTIQSQATLVFQMTGGGSPTQAGIIINNALITIDTTGQIDLQASVISTPNCPACTFTITDFDVQTTKKPPQSN